MRHLVTVSKVTYSFGGKRGPANDRSCKERSRLPLPDLLKS